MLRFIVATALLLLPAAIHAACTGNDLRETLSPAEQDALAQRLDGVPYPTGNFWTATRGAQRIDLIGTVHVADPRLDAFEDRIAPLITAADVLMVEAGEAELKALQTATVAQPELLFLTEGPTLIEQMGDDAWGPVAEAARERGVPGFLAAKMQPWYLMVTLSLPPCVTKELQGQLPHGLDARAMDVAKAADVPTVALEPFDTMFKIFTDIPIDEQIALLNTAIIPVERANDMFITLMHQYFAEEHAAALEVSRIVALRDTPMTQDAFDAAWDAFIDVILNQRNLAWMDRIAENTAERIVIAVGAGHLGGDTGLLNLLEQAGYTITRMQAP